jgi:predicted protein tyrosine phosphatase
MARSRRVLFVCEGNLHRSPTAERLYSLTPGIDARSAGLSGLARVQVTDELLAWTDAVVLMERRLWALVRRQFAVGAAGKQVICLRVRDHFQFMQPERLAILTDQLSPHLGPPTPIAEPSVRPNGSV